MTGYAHQSACENLSHPVTGYKYEGVVKLDHTPVSSYVAGTFIRAIPGASP